jgi:hypothetical protein
VTTFAAAPTAHASTWEQWLHLPGVFDLAGPRSDGLLVAAVHSRLVLLSTAGEQRAFAPQYSVPDGSESYIALSPGLRVESAGCAFARDELFTLDVKTTPPGVARVGVDGSVSHLATVAGVSTLSGITLDTVGDFGHRLLVVGPSGQGHTLVAAIDCKGTVTPLGVVATSLEGGIGVAPHGFGSFGGQLIAPNEGNGTVYAVSPTGTLSVVAASGVAAGGDIGVESVGVVPAGGAAAAYVADRGTPGNPHPGTDSVLRLTGSVLSQAGVRAGDVLVATEGGDTVVDIRCAAVCMATVVANGPPPAHGEGRLLVVAAPNAIPPAHGAPGGAASAVAATTPSTDHRTTLVTGAVIVGALLVVASASTLALLRRRRRV